MKKLFFLILFLFFSFSSIAQTYTKKYNSINGRYEYHNSNGTLVAYEVYNSIYNRWDYYTVNNDNNPYNRKPIETPPVQSNVNLQLIDKVMSQKQSNYDNNVQTIQNTINTLSNKISNLNISSELKESIHDDFDRVLNVLNTNRYDYSNNSTTNDIVNWLYNEYNRIIKKANEKIEKANHMYNKEINEIAYNSGYYYTQTVTDEKYNPYTNKYEILKTDNSLTKANINVVEKQLCYYRQVNKVWRCYTWSYKGSSDKFYELIDINQGNLLWISKDFKTIIFYEEKVGNTYTKRYVYHNLIKDKQ